MCTANVVRRTRLIVCLVCGMLLAAATASGQSKAVLAELGKLHDRLAQPDKTLSERDGREARDRIAEWKLTPEKLSPENRARLLRVETYAALAIGDARTALDKATSLMDEFSDDAASCEAAYLAACAGGDARLGGAALKKLGKYAKGEQRRRISLRRRQMHGVGRKAPDVTIRADDMTEFRPTRRKGRLLLIDFWNMSPAPDPDTVAALRDLHALYENSLRFELVGVNSDGEADAPAAKAFAKDNGYVWPQRYEYESRKAPITHGAFHAGKPPWQVLIDTYGYVRAVGDLREPGLQYAVRAAVSEARGDREIVMVRSRDGKQPEKPGAKIKAPVKKKPKAGVEEKPSNPEAAQKLTLARTYLKTGKKTDAKRLFQEIVRDYPGTPEAREAQEYLDTVFP